jgi:NAD+ synthase
MRPQREFDEDLIRIDCEKARRLLVGFLRNEVTKTGLQRAVIGLSGGVDSALSAALSAEALGPEQVTGAILPHRVSNPESLVDARLVAEQLGIATREIDITPMVDPYFELYEPEADQVRVGNVMARVRMLILYDISRKERALVIGTSNRTEILLGYSTLFGDSAHALNPLGDLLKTQVWQLSEYLGLPERVIQKPPSADLWQGQTDEEELGIDYYTADRVLALLVDQRLSRGRISEYGFPEETIDRITMLIKRSQFKRMPPIIAKLGHRTINRDFRYPRDWGL